MQGYALILCRGWLTQSQLSLTRQDVFRQGPVSGNRVIYEIRVFYATIV
jgi:hypothetical protein